MKVLSSSPYAVFRAKEWNSYCRKTNSGNYSGLLLKNKEHCKNSKRFNSSKILKNQYKTDGDVQLSFAHAII
tara:strand:- start:1061 stop:1276 length:216 start_codon:yes stop_codon:yes gene_type:complete